MTFYLRYNANMVSTSESRLSCSDKPHTIKHGLLHLAPALTVTYLPNSYKKIHIFVVKSKHKDIFTQHKKTRLNFNKVTFLLK